MGNPFWKKESVRFVRKALEQLDSRPIFGQNGSYIDNSGGWRGDR